METGRFQSVRMAPLTQAVFDFVRGLPAFPEWQRTLVRPAAWLAGPEPHTNARIRMRLLPAPPDTGIVFLPTTVPRKELPGQFGDQGRVRCRLEDCEVQGFTMSVSNGYWRVAHIEHLLACLYSLGLDNAYVVIQKPVVLTEIFRELGLPLFRTSTLPYVAALARAGLVEQVGSRRRYRTVKAPFRLVAARGGDVIEAVPGPGFRVRYTAGYQQLGIPNTKFSLDLTPASYTREISEARTMVNRLNRWHYNVWRLLGSIYFITYGFGIGVNRENAITSLRGEILSRRRYGGECSELVRHKIMDFLAAVRFLGPLRDVHFTVTRSGHRHDLDFCRGVEPRLAPWRK